MQVALFASSYFPSVQYVHHLLSFPEAIIDAHEYFPKQTNRNRCHILGPNGVQSIFIPLVQTHAPTISENVFIDFTVDWKTQHWRSLESAYNRSAFFEFYKDELSRLYFTPQRSLLQFNTSLLHFILAKLKQPRTLSFSTSFIKHANNDWRQLSNLKNHLPLPPAMQFKKYPQVFSTKFPFIPNLSVLDLLFNCGPQAISFL